MICTVAGCTADGRLRVGMCNKHYIRTRVHGAPIVVAPWVGLTDGERFWTKVDKSLGEAGCWLWTGERQSAGYGRFCTYAGSERTRHLAHRYVLGLVGRQLAPGLVVMHSCDTPLCVNPAHLSEGTQRDNLRDAMGKGRLDITGLLAYTARRDAAVRARMDVAS